MARMDEIPSAAGVRNKIKKASLFFPLFFPMFQRVVSESLVP